MRRHKAKTLQYCTEDTAAPRRTPTQRSEMEFGVAADAYRSRPSKLATRDGAVALTLAIGAVTFCVVLGIFWAVSGSVNLIAIVVAALLALLAFSSVHIALDWEKAVVLRLGKFNRLAGPGLFFTIPFIEYCTITIDQRTIITPFGAEETLTADLVPLDIDAVLSWMIFDPKRACTEVEDCYFAVALAAQTALREAIGRANIADVVMRREQLDQELRDAIERHVSCWGATVIGMEIRNILIPEKLQGVMSLEAQAAQRKNARVILAETESAVSKMYADAAETYRDNPVAYDLRRLQLAYEGVQESGSTIMVPSAYTAGFTGEAQVSAEEAPADAAGE